MAQGFLQKHHLFLNCLAIIGIICLIRLSLQTQRYEPITPMVISTHQTENGTPSCNEMLLKSYFRTHHKFPEEGVWRDSASSWTRYSPKLCAFRECDVMSFLKCRKLQHILLIGDSQGKKSNKKVLRYFETLPDVECELVLKANITNRFSDYFSRNGVTIEPVRDLEYIIKECQYCISTLSFCTRMKDGFRVTIEYIEIYQWTGADVEVRGYPGRSPFQCSFADYIFKYYYTKGNYPDIVFMFSNFNHLKKEIPIERQSFYDSLRQRKKLLQLSLPNTSYTVWLTNVMEFELGRTEESKKYAGKRYGGLLAGEVMYRFSQWLYDFLAVDLESPSSRQLGFFNMVNMTSSLVARALYGVHMEDEFYNQYLKYLFQTMCSGSLSKTHSVSICL